MPKPDVKVTKDPANPGTVILDRWPTAKEKTRKFREEVAKARGISPELVVDEPQPAVDEVEPIEEEQRLEGEEDSEG